MAVYSWVRNIRLWGEAGRPLNYFKVALKQLRLRNMMVGMSSHFTILDQQNT